MTSEPSQSLPVTILEFAVPRGVIAYNPCHYTASISPLQLGNGRVTIAERNLSLALEDSVIQVSRTRPCESSHPFHSFTAPHYLIEHEIASDMIIVRRAESRPCTLMFNHWKVSIGFNLQSSLALPQLGLYLAPQ